jgi:predicted amino acid dehydrogenase
LKFATIGHLIEEENIEYVPKNWLCEDIIVSPEMNVDGTKGHLLILKITAKQIMNMPQEEIRQKILDAAIFAQNELGVNVVQLGALTTSVTSGGKWLVDQKEYAGFVTHGDSYTAAVTCQAVFKALNLFKKKPSELVLAIVGTYGIIGEAVSKLLVPKFSHSILIGPRKEKLNELETKIKGSFETTVDLKTKNADVVITATNHPTALLNSNHLKRNAIVVDVSQPPNLSLEVCKKRPDICRIDGGFVDFPT